MPVGTKFLGLILFAFLAELIWSKVKQNNVYNFKETIGNLGIVIGNNLLKPVSLGWKFLVFSAVESYQVFTIPTNGLSLIHI